MKNKPGSVEGRVVLAKHKLFKININYLITIWQKMEPKPNLISNLPTKSIALMEDFVYDKSGIKKRAQVGDL
jgi:hypothetical protein